MVRAKSYSPIADEINPAIAIIQAARLLDKAAEYAISHDNVDEINSVAAGWLQLSAQLSGIMEEEEDGEEHELGSEPDRYPMGFRPNEPVEPDEDEDEEEEEPEL